MHTGSLISFHKRYNNTGAFDCKSHALVRLPKNIIAVFIERKKLKTRDMIIIFWNGQLYKVLERMMIQIT